MSMTDSIRQQLEEYDVMFSENQDASDPRYPQGWYTIFSFMVDEKFDVILRAQDSNATCRVLITIGKEEPIFDSLCNWLGSRQYRGLSTIMDIIDALKRIGSE